MSDIWSDLVLWWRLDSESAADSSGSGLDGTPNNSPEWTTGKLGGGLSVNGSNSHISRASYQVPSSGTLALWMKPGRAYNSGVDEYVWSIGNGNPEFSLRHFSANQIYCGFWRSGNDDRVVLTASSSNWEQDVWQHWCLTWVSSGDLKLYRNGAQIGSTIGTIDSSNSTFTLRAGTRYNGSAGFLGDLDDFRIYDAAKSDTDVTAIYNWRPGARYYRRILAGAA